MTAVICWCVEVFMCCGLMRCCVGDCVHVYGVDGLMWGDFFERTVVSLRCYDGDAGSLI